jgi:hypothetical protein
MEDLYKDITELVQIVLAILLACIILYITRIGCPIRFLTGICCPGCGITRAILSLLQGDLQKAIYFHPLFWFPFIFVVLWLYRRHFSAAQTKLFLIAAIVLYLLVYLVRLTTGSDVVVCRPEDGLIYKIIKYVLDAAQ